MRSLWVPHGADADGKTAMSSPYRHGIVAGLIVVALGIGLLWFIKGKMQEGSRDTTPREPTAQPTNVVQKVSKPKAKTPSSHVVPQSHKVPSTMEAKTATEPTPPTAEEKPRHVIVNDGSLRPKDPFAVVKLNSDKQIAALVYADPGQMVIGSVDFGESFEEQFKESLKTKLVAPEDASEADRDIIATVNAARDSIVKGMQEEGKTAGEICAETREQLRKFWEYKEMLKSEIRRFENDAEKTDEDVSDLFDAANKILKENDITPFEPNDLTREVVRQHKFDQIESATSEKEK